MAQSLPCCSRPVREEQLALTLSLTVAAVTLAAAAVVAAAVAAAVVAVKGTRLGAPVSMA